MQSLKAFSVKFVTGAWLGERSISCVPRLVLWLFVIGLAGSCESHGQALQQGLLEASLTAGDNPIIVKRTLGSLTGRAKTAAIFTAIIVKDRADPDKRVKGLKIKLTEEGRAVTLFLDHDQVGDRRFGNLQGFEEALRDFSPFGTPKAGIDNPLEEVRTRPARNRTGTMILNAGPYTRGKEEGVLLDGHAFRGSEDAVAAYFPNVKLTAVIDLIAAARLWLDSN